MAKTVLVLGGSMAGLGITHRLLKYTLPHEPDMKVILVSKNSHLYWNPASVRAVVPGQIRDEEILQPIQPGLEQYPASSVEFILGTAMSLDRDARKVDVSTAQGTRPISYDYLVLATGARASNTDMPWKASTTYEECIENLHRTAKAVGEAEHITIVGAGATGVETAGEIKFEYGDKKQVLLLCADKELLGGDSTASNVEHELIKLGVEIRKNTRSEKVEKMDDGKTKVTLQGGETIMTDFYMPTMGLVPNTEYLPKDALTEKGFVDVDAQFRVKEIENAWALGDVVSKPRASFPETDAQAGGVIKNIELALKGKDQVPVKGMPVDVLICTIGRSRGAGRVGWIKPPSITIWAIKGRTLGRERTAKYVNGTAF